MKSKKEINPILKEVLIIIFAAIILTLSINYGKKNPIFLEGFIIFGIIIFTNYIIKKIVARHFEVDILLKPWEIYYFGLRENNHLKKPVPMIWFPLFISLLTIGKLWWFPILEFDVKAKPERATRRHGIYRFSEVTENHIAYIVFWSILATLLISTIGYILGFEYFAKIGIFYTLWSLVPISKLDGSKLFFGDKKLWVLTLLISLIFFIGILLI